MNELEALTLADIKARYRKGPKGYYYQPPAETMWGDARALIVLIEDLEHELSLARQHLDVCPTWQAVCEDERAKRSADV